jgi:hypothetical protein
VKIAHVFSSHHIVIFLCVLCCFVVAPLHVALHDNFLSLASRPIEAKGSRLFTFTSSISSCQRVSLGCAVNSEGAQRQQGLWVGRLCVCRNVVATPNSRSQLINLGAALCRQLKQNCRVRQKSAAINRPRKDTRRKNIIKRLLNILFFSVYFLLFLALLSHSKGTDDG